jgi:hypothetical protein
VQRVCSQYLSGSSAATAAIKPAATTLLKYDAACRSVAEAKAVDEVKDVRDKAIAMQLYARQAKNKSLEADAAEIRERAEYRLGELLAVQRSAGLLNPGTRLIGGGDGAGGSVRNPPADLPTLRDLGINKVRANKARKASSLLKETFEAVTMAQQIWLTRGYSRSGIANRLKTNKRQTFKTRDGSYARLVTDHTAHLPICPPQTRLARSRMPLSQTRHIHTYLTCLGILPVMHRSG